MRECRVLLAIALLIGLGVAAPPAVASERPLVLAIGAETDAGGQAFPQAGRVLPVLRALEGRGADVLSRNDAGRAAALDLFAQFGQIAPPAPAVVIALSGRFRHTPGGAWFLPDGAAPGGPAGLLREAIPLSAVLDLLAGRDGASILLLSVHGPVTGEATPGVSNGVGPLSIPGGVTVIRGRPDRIAAFVTEALGRPGADLHAAAQRIDGIEAHGAIAAGLRFLGAEPAAGARDAWRVARERDDAEGYRAYLRTFPGAPNAAEARARIAAIEDAPNRAARGIEDRLGLDGPGRRAIQRNLAILGHDPGGIDGVFGPATRAAIRAWQRTASRAPTGYLDAGQVDRLDRAARERRAAARDSAAASSETALNIPRPLRRAVEARLAQLGLEPGPVDGRLDRQARRAIGRFQRRSDLPVTGFLDEATAVELLAGTLGDLVPAR